MEHQLLSSRPLEEKDLPVLMDYWYSLNDGQLESMGVDLEKFPKRKDFEANIRKQLSLPIKDRHSFAMIWEVNGQPVGHNSINFIEFGIKANMHLHLWNASNRQKGIGIELLKKSIPAFFHHLKFKT